MHTQAEAFANWLACYQRSQAKRQLLLDAVTSIQHGTLVRAFRSWTVNTSEKARLRAVAATCAARMRMAVQHRAFAGWKLGAHEIARHRCATCGPSKSLPAAERCAMSS